MALSVGDPAPDFTLPGTPAGTSYTLSQFRGRPVVLAFYPGDDTPVCTRQLTSYTDGIERFEAVDAQVLGISPQGVASHEKFSDKLDLKFPLLADEDKRVFDLYGALGPVGFPRRSVFVIDAEGVVRYAHRAIAGLTFRSTDELTKVLADL